MVTSLAGAGPVADPDLNIYWETGMANKCCEEFAMRMDTPRSRPTQHGTQFEERHRCPTCGTWLNILFETVLFLGENEAQYQTVSFSVMP